MGAPVFVYCGEDAKHISGKLPKRQVRFWRGFMVGIDHLNPDWNRHGWRISSQPNNTVKIRTQVQFKEKIDEEPNITKYPRLVHEDMMYSPNSKHKPTPLSAAKANKRYIVIPDTEEI